MTTTRTYTRRLERWIIDATPQEIEQAAQWYEDARAVAYDVAERRRVDLESAAAIIAAFSPRVTWKRNIHLSLTYAAGEPVACLGASLRAANRATAHGLEALTAPKVRNFAQAIAGDPDAVVVDVWICRAAGLEKISPTLTEYRRISEAITKLARRYDMTPRTMQALIWIKVRGKAD